MAPPSEPRWTRRVALACGLALALGYLPHQIYGRSGLARLFSLRRSLGQLRRHAEAARAENGRLRAQAALLRSDPRALERVARDTLGLVKPGEIVYEIEEGGGLVGRAPGAPAVPQPAALRGVRGQKGGRP